MKSIMQEGSSIIKAIEQAWVNAGKPKEFSIKIFEEAQKNFIGMTTKSAKVGIFFQEPKPEIAPRAKTEQKTARPSYERPPAYQQKKEVTQTTHAARNQEKKQQPETQQRVVWHDDMVQAARQWLEQALIAMQKADVAITIDVNNYYVRFVINKPLVDDAERERQLFKSFSFLMLQALKRRFRRPLRGFKIVLARNA